MLHKSSISQVTNNSLSLGNISLTLGIDLFSLLISLQPSLPSLLQKAHSEL